MDPSRNQDVQQWMRAAKARAEDLREMALSMCNLLFDQGDLRSYVEILSRFHGYNFYNLLLILNQYPTATHLAPFKVWEQHLGNPALRVLKRDHIGKGIELMAPYTDLQLDGTRALSWHGIRRFDISQTNVTDVPVPSKGYQPDPIHTDTLVAALRILLSQKHCISLIYERGNPNLLRTGAVGYRNGPCLYCRHDAPPQELVHWLCGVLLELSYPENLLGERCKSLFCHLATACLLRIWDIDNPSLLYIRPDRDLVRSVPSELRPVFLDLLQRRVRSIEESVYSHYQERTRGRGEAQGPGRGPRHRRKESSTP